MGKSKYGHWDDPDNKYRDLIPYVDDVLETYSKRSRSKYFNHLVDLALFLQEQYNTTLLEAKGTQIKRYFKEKVDPRDIKKSTKKLYRNYISGYYSEVKRLKKDLENDHGFVNPVPSNKTISFSGIDRPLEITLSKEYLTVDHAKQILEHIYFTRNNEQVFYASALIIFSGARVSEVCEVKLEKLNVEERWFINRVKSQKQNKREGIYFFPKFFQEPLKDYIAYLKQEFNDPIYLFESPYYKNKSFHFSKRTVEKAFASARETLGIKTKASPHQFRNLLNTKRYEKNLQDADLRFLLNHKQKEVYAAHYLKNRQNRVKLRQIYDKSFPYTKDILPSVLYGEERLL
jgi:integrase